MKKIREFISPFISIILGAILFLVYLNYLQLSGFALVIGIIGFLISFYYLLIGIVNIFISDKLSLVAKNILNLVSITLFPLFIFICDIMGLVNNGSTSMGPTAWAISIISLITSLCLIVTYIVMKVSPNNESLNKIAFLIASIFVLVLILDLVFDHNGYTISIGDIDLVGLLIYSSYGLMLFDSLAASNSEPKKIEMKEYSSSDE